jgi:hypothetical protein
VGVHLVDGHGASPTPSTSSIRCIFIHRRRARHCALMPRTGSSQIAGTPVLRPLACRADSWPLEVKLVAGHAAGGSRPGRRDAADVLSLYTGSGSGPGHELTDGRGHRPWIIQRAGPVRRPGPGTSRQGQPAAVQFARGRGRAWLPGACPLCPGVTLSDAGGQRERTRTRRSARKRGARQSDPWLRRTGRSVHLQHAGSVGYCDTVQSGGYRATGRWCGRGHWAG